MDKKNCVKKILYIIMSPDEVEDIRLENPSFTSDLTEMDPYNREI